MIRASRPGAPKALPPSPLRLIVCAVYDRSGRIDDFIPYSLRGLRQHAAHILVVSNGGLTPESRAALEAVSDEILVRENSGFDIGAHRAALAHLGPRIEEFDEIILTNDTWYGPVRSWEPVLSRMSGTSCHFWGLTDHAPTRPNPITGKGIAPYHLQSYWIAVRREMFASEAWRSYWKGLPPLDSYEDAVTEHELRFTRHFSAQGWTGVAAFPYTEFDTENPSLYEAESLIDAGCPVLKRRPLFHWPPRLDAYAAVGRWALATATAEGYPSDLMLTNLARTVPPKALNVDAGLLSVLPGPGPGPGGVGDSGPLPRTLVAIHAGADDIDHLLDRADTIPGGYDLVVTICQEAFRNRIDSSLTARRPGDRLSEVRMVPHGPGCLQKAFYLGCRDLLADDRYDLVTRLHAPAAGSSPAERLTADHLLTSLLLNREYTAAAIGLFQREPHLGIVYPPATHLGVQSLGKSWSDVRPAFEEWSARLGITVPLDDVSPLAPFGSMFMARPSALRLLLAGPWTDEDFRSSSAGELAAVLVRMPSYAAGELGYYTRTIASREYVSISHPILEYELSEMSSTIPGRSFEKIDFLRHSGPVGTGSARDLLRMYLHRRHVELLHFGRRLIDPRRRPGRWIRGSRTSAPGEEQAAQPAAPR